MSAIGHNESAVRLAALAGDALIALDKVAKGEADAIEGWLAYGAALNEGRALFAEDKAFGKWISENLSSNLEVHPAEQSAAMWAAAHADQLAEAKAASKARTLRGWHDQWKKIEAEREAEAKRLADEAARKKAAEEAASKKKEVDEKAKAEAEAKAAAKSAKDDKERQAAEARAAEASEATKAAEKEAGEAEAAAQSLADQEPEEDEATAKLRKEFRKLTSEGQEDDWIGLKTALAEQKSKVAKLKAENAKLKEQLRGHAGDKDETIRRLTKAIEHKSSEMYRANEKFDAEKRKNYALKKRVDELEAMEIKIC